MCDVSCFGWGDPAPTKRVMNGSGRGDPAPTKFILLIRDSDNQRGELNGGIETPNTVGDPKSLSPKEFAIAKDPKRCHNPSHTTRFILSAI